MTVSKTDALAAVRCCILLLVMKHQTYGFYIPQIKSIYCSLSQNNQRVHRLDVLMMSPNRRIWKPFEDAVLYEQIKLLGVKEGIIPWRRVVTHPKLDGKFDAREARARYVLLQKVDDGQVCEILPLLDEWLYADGGRLRGLVYGYDGIDNGEEFTTDPVTFSTQYIIKTLSENVFELGDPLDAAVKSQTQKQGKNMKLADDFLNSIIIGCVIVGGLAQAGLVPFFGSILGNEYNYFSSDPSPTVTQPEKSSKKQPQSEPQKAASPSSRLQSSVRKRFFAQDTDIGGIFEESSNNDDRIFEKIAGQLEALDKQLGEEPFSLDGLMDEDEMDDDAHGDIQSQSDNADDIDHTAIGVLF